jgi:hypothetical protein
MAESTFTIIFSGKMAEGNSPPEVLIKLRTILGLPDDRIREIFKPGDGAVIRADLDRDGAMALLEQLQGVGVICRMEETEPLPIMAVKPHRTRTAHPASLTIPYESSKKVIRAIIGFLEMCLFLTCLFSDEFVLHLIGVTGLVFVLAFLVEWLATTEIVLEQDRIVKRRMFFGETVIPARRAVIVMDNFTIRFFHGSTVNSRERITIRRAMIAAKASDRIVEFADKQYDIRLSKTSTEEGSATFEGSATGRGRKVGGLLLEPFTKSVNTYRLAIVTMTIAVGIAIIVVGVSDTFPGVAPGLPAFAVRLAAGLLALAAYPLLGKLNLVNGSVRFDSILVNSAQLPWNLRFRDVERCSSQSALIISAVAALGFTIFLLFGNILDLYLFITVCTFYYLDFFPRLSVWERLGEGRREQADGAETAQLMVPVPTRRRSMQVSLALMGVLAVSSYGESHNYLYKSKKDCLDDWGSEQSCTEPQQGSPYHRSGYYYGPRYGSGYSRSTSRSVGTVSVSRGGFGSLGGLHASFGG